MNLPRPPKPFCSNCHSMIRQRARSSGYEEVIEWIHVYPVQRPEGGINFWSLCHPDGVYRASLGMVNKFPRPMPFYLTNDNLPWMQLQNSHRKPIGKLP